jgi:hypothetical protein
LLTIRFGPVRAEPGLAIDRDGITASLFVREASFADLAALVGEARARALGPAPG